MRKKKLLCMAIIMSLLFSNNYIYAEFESEDGRDHIVGSEEGEEKERVYNSYEKTANFYLYNEVSTNVYSNASTSSNVVGTLSPQMLTATKRKGNYFYIGTGWIIKNDNVQLREIESMDDAKFTTQEVVNIHTQPFSSFKTGVTLPIGTYSIKRKAGDWFYIEQGSYTGWFNTSRGSFLESKVSLPVSSIEGIPVKVKMANISNNVRPGMPMKPKYITIHNTANTGRGANAQSHANLLYNESINGSRYASWHFSVDNKEVYQSLPLNEIGYHAGDGDGPGNRNSIGIEICENIDGNYEIAEKNAAILTAYLLRTHNLPLSSVRMHRDFSGKNCPARIIAKPNGWNIFMKNVEDAYNRMGAQFEPEDTNKYYLDMQAFYGEDSINSAKNMLSNDTGWYLQPEKIYYDATKYRIVTGEFNSESIVKDALNQLMNLTGWWARYELTSNGKYRIVTGEFTGEESVKSGLSLLKSNTGWWATTERTSDYNHIYESTKFYRIETGEFNSESIAKDALNQLINLTGWWATYVPTSNGKYRIITGEFRGEDSVRNGLELLKSSTGWWATYEHTGRVDYSYRLKTGYFPNKRSAEENANMIRNKYGWFTQVKVYNN